MPARRMSVGVRSTPASKYFRQSLARDGWNRTPSHGPGRARTPGKTPGKTPSKNSSGAAAGGSVKVVVRVRPENGKEQQGNYKVVVKAMDEQCVVFDPKEEDMPDFYHGQKRTGRDLLKKQNKDMRFAFDRVFDNQASNQDVYNETTKSLLDGLLDGYNCSVFAYGATGAGKTFTMLGTPSQPGVMFLTMMDLYQRIEAVKDKKICEVAISYLEVYNEQIKDLLLPSGYLPVREDPQNGVIVSGLSLHKPRSAEELLHMLDFGNKNRTQHPTDANAESSRSHAVFQVFVRQKERTANISAEVKVAKMSLIDLAGSERATATKNMGKRFREGANINRSLLALGNCINALAEGKSRAFVPYRDSKLTRLLKDSLGGNCRTLMIAAVSPSAMTYEDTYNTLKYANRAKNIKVELKSNVMNVDFHVTRYQQIVEELRGEITELKEKLEKSEQQPKNASGDGGTSDTFMQELERLQMAVSEIFDQRVLTRKELMEYESSQRELTYKRHSKQRCLNRLNIISDSSYDKEKLIAKYKRFIERSEKRLETVVQRKMSAEERMLNNTALLQKLQGELQAHHVVKNELASQNLALSLRCRHLEVELRDTKRQVQFLKKLCRHHGRELHSTDKLDSTLLKTVQKQYYLMQDAGLATSDIVADYEAICREVEGDREVAWADQSVLDATLGSGADCTMAEGAFDNGLDYTQLLDFPVLHEVTFTPPKKSFIAPLPGENESDPSASESISAVPATPGLLIATPGRTPAKLSGLCTPGAYSATPMDFNTPAGGDLSIAFTPGTSEQPSCPNSVEPNSVEHSTVRRALTDTISNTVQQFMPGDAVAPQSGTVLAGLNSTFTMDGVEPLPDSPSGSDSSEQNSEASLREQHEKNKTGSSNTAAISKTYIVSNSSLHQAQGELVHPKTSLHTISENDHHISQKNYHHKTSHQPHIHTQNHQRPHGTHAFVSKHDSNQYHPVPAPRHKPAEPSNHEPSRPLPIPAPRNLPLDVTITLEPGESLVDSPHIEKPEIASTHRKTTTEYSNKPVMVVDLPCTPPSADHRVPATGEKPHYRRIVDFQQENMPSPAGRMTFADVVRSPAVVRAVAKVQSLFNKPLSDLKAPETPRSPLAPRQNLPDVTPSSQRKRDKESSSSSAKKWTKLARTSNKKYALPSVLESISKLRRAQTFNTHQDAPRYMQMTKASVRRHRNHRRSLSGTVETPQHKSSIPGPGRVLKPSSVEVKENKPGRSLAQRKWISSTAIGQRSTFL